MNFRESAIQFGPTRKIFGVLTEPTQAARSPRFGLILVNAGLLPKFGPFRLYAQLARRLAADGIVTLRFDLGGIGDSEQEFQQLDFQFRTRAEYACAIDALMTRERKLEGVFLGGLCSGAEDSFRQAEEDDRVRGVMMIDPFGYRTPGWRWRDLRHRIFRKSLKQLGLYDPTPYSGQGSLVDYKYMEHSESSRILKKLLARGVRSHFVYTGGMREHVNHAGQLGKMFAEIEFGDRVSVDYFGHIGHTQLLIEDRSDLVDTMSSRIASWAK
jgi:hypothetical protein